MNKIFARPKKFGEILDLTFQLCKQHFSSLFLILFVFVGPLIVIQAIVQLLSGRSFVREVASGESFIEQFINTYDQSAINISGAEIGGNLFIGLLQMLFYPVAVAAIILLVKRVKDQDSYTVKSLIKQAFSRFWPLFWSTVLLSIIFLGILFFPLLIVGLIGAIVTVGSPPVGILFILLSFIGVLFGVGLLMSRWSFYLPSLLFDRIAPGMTKSWQLTQGRSWMTFWLYVTLAIIVAFISLAVEFPALFLGTSVLYHIIVNIVSIFTMLIFFVGYAVMYFDLEVRQSADDLKDMISDYQVDDNHDETIR